MGFLDNSTNNIIVDAVLTDAGREALSRNDGSFSIVKFAFGDDEVDYTLIKKFGRTVGKQKIELNTPVFEAQTNQNLALKYRLLTYGNAALYNLPSLSIVGTTSTIAMTTAAGGAPQTRVTFEQKLEGEQSLDAELADSMFIVKIPAKFLEIVGDAPDSRDSDDVAHYVMSASPGSATGLTNGSALTFTLKVKALSNNLFNYYGDQGNTGQITTTFSVQGLQSGARSDMTVVIKRPQ
jgi:hypothetical protein